MLFHLLCYLSLFCLFPTLMLGSITLKFLFSSHGLLQDHLVYKLWLIWFICLSRPVQGKTFTLGFLPALSELKQNRYFVGAAECAIQDINSCQLVHQHRLSLEVRDNKGDTKTSLQALTELYMYRHPVAVIGPEETCAVEARVADAWNLPMIAWVSQHYSRIRSQNTCLFLKA